MSDAQPYQPPIAVEASTSATPASGQAASKYPWTLAGVAIGLSVLLTLTIVLTRAPFIEVMAEFGLKLPVITQIVISAGWLVASAIHAMCLFMANTILVFVRIIEPKSANGCRRIAQSLNWMSVAFSFLFGAIYFAGLFLPLLGLINGLS